jgi:hypothetical protein
VRDGGRICVKIDFADGERTLNGMVQETSVGAATVGPNSDDRVLKSPVCQVLSDYCGTPVPSSTFDDYDVTAQQSER